MKFLFLVIMLVAFTSSAVAGEIIVAAGAGLKDIITDLATAFTERNPSTKITKNIVVSGVLAKQLDSGARADVVFTANREWMDYLNERKHIDTTTVTSFAYNTLVVVGKGTPRAGRLDDLIKLERMAVASPRSVPAGEYAMQALRNAGIDKQMEKKLVMARDVRECLLYAERGEADGAFVYKTDALLSKEVAIWFTVPQKLYSRVVYMSALTLSGAKNQDAARFFSFLQSADARASLLKYGFEVQ